VIPSGAQITQLTDARTDEPFNEFVKHQEEVICIMAIGGSLNTLGGSTGLGSNLADKQDEQFQSLINNDGKKIQNTINSVAINKVLKGLGFNKTLCRFQFTEQDDTTPQEYLELAKQAKDLGATIDIQKLKEVTGLQFISMPNQEESEIWSPN
jgi:hypothetical protein